VKSLLLALFLGSALPAVLPAPRPIDTARSTAKFSVRRTHGENVTGTIPILRGSLTLTPGSMIPQSADAVLDATRISTGDPSRDRALESPDCFDAKRFPQWTFTSTKVVPKGSSAFEMDGNLTLHGVTRPESLSVTVSGTPEHASYHATAQIDRHAFGMARTRLDPALGADAKITLDITAK
jgi:polyisoprenoid-binding protein YceI